MPRPPKRKASEGVKQAVKRFQSTKSRIRSVNQQKESSASSSAQPESNVQNAVRRIVAQDTSDLTGLFHTGVSANIYKEIDNYQRSKERRIILIGKTGTGKSTLGNAMLGCKRFETDGVQMHSITTHCNVGQKKSKDGKDIVVLDTPGLKDTNREQAKIIEELCKCTAMMAPGPHALCLVVRGDDRFTQESIDTLDEFCAFFGEDIYKYVIVVFTHKASMGKSTTTDDCLFALPQKFRTKFSKVGGKKIAIESTAEKEELENQINELFKLIEETIERNDGGYYSEEKFKAAEEAFRNRIPTIQQEEEKRFKVKKRSLANKYQMKEKRSRERKNQLIKERQELEEKFELEKQLKKQEKPEKDACAAEIKRLEAKHQKEKKSLEKKLEKKIEKERKEKEKIKEEYKQKMEEINEKHSQDLLDIIIEYRSKGRKAVGESTSFDEVARNAVMEGAGVAFDKAKRYIGNIIGAMRSLVRT